MIAVYAKTSLEGIVFRFTLGDVDDSSSWSGQNDALCGSVADILSDTELVVSPVRHFLPLPSV
jgi:hypothetical protein